MLFVYRNVKNHYLPFNGEGYVPNAWSSLEERKERHSLAHNSQ